MSKRILLFGDSNTWGYDPDASAHSSYHVRFPWEVRYAGVLQKLLGSEYHVIEEGLNGRTTVWDDPLGPDRNGSKQLTVCLQTHKPLDLVVIMLGTNDMKMRISANAYDSAKGTRMLAEMALQCACGREGGVPPLLLVSPAPIGADVEHGVLADEFGSVAAHEASLKLAQYMQRVAEDLGCAFLDAGQYVETGSDAIHLNAQGHAVLGKTLADTIRNINI